MAGNSNLNSAKTARKDEFYTQLTDIEKEMRYYRKHFQGKTVLCNCDDPFESNFFKYFALNFNRLGLKKLIATCYYSSPIAGQQLQYGCDANGQMTFYSECVVHDKTRMDCRPEKGPCHLSAFRDPDCGSESHQSVYHARHSFRSGKTCTHNRTAPDYYIFCPLHNTRIRSFHLCKSKYNVQQS